MPFTKGQLGNELVLRTSPMYSASRPYRWGGGAAVTPCKSALNATVKGSVVDAENDSGTDAALP